MADQSIGDLVTAGKEISGAPATDDLLYIINISESGDEDYSIEIDNFFTFLEGTYTGNVVLGSGQTLSVDADADSAAILGPAKVGYDGATTDVACFAHYDQMAAATFALSQDASGGTIVNAATGQVVSLRINDTEIAQVGANGISQGADTNVYAIIGRAKIGYDGATDDVAIFGHYDHATATNFALSHDASGGTILNAATGQVLSLRINDTEIAQVGANGLSQGADTDVYAIVGRAKIGYDGATSDVAVFAHYDQMSATNFALSQDASAGTIVNAATGQVVSLRINDVEIAQVGANGISQQADTDAYAVFGRAQVGHATSLDDYATFAHIDNFSQTDYAITQSAAGATYLNAKTGQSVGFRVNNASVMTMDSDGLTVASSKTLTVDGVPVDGKKSLQFVAFGSGAAVTTGDGTDGMAIPADMNGLDLIAAVATVHDKGVTGTTDVMVRRWRAGAAADMLSTAITIGDEWFAADGVIDTSNDDVQTGDRIYVDVDAIHSGTAPNGLTVVLTFG